MVAIAMLQDAHTHYKFQSDFYSQYFITTLHHSQLGRNR